MIDTLKDCSLPSPVLWILSILSFIFLLCAFIKQGVREGVEAVIAVGSRSIRVIEIQHMINKLMIPIILLTNWLMHDYQRTAAIKVFGVSHVSDSVTWYIHGEGSPRCFSGSNVDWRVYRNVTSPLFLARRSPLSKIGVLEMSYRSRLSN